MGLKVVAGTDQVHENLLTNEEVEECISIEFNPVRAGFHGSQEVWTRDVLNLGVKPDMLIAKACSHITLSCTLRFSGMVTCISLCTAIGFGQPDVAGSPDCCLA